MSLEDYWDAIRYYTLGAEKEEPPLGKNMYRTRCIICYRMTEVHISTAPNSATCYLCTACPSCGRTLTGGTCIPCSPAVDLNSVIYAYRNYRIVPADDSRGGWILAGTTGFKWDTKELYFECGRYGIAWKPQQKDNPDLWECLKDGHSCGIYSTKTKEILDKQVVGLGEVTAMVTLAGQVYEMEKGYRSSYAKIERLILDAKHDEIVCKDLAGRYGVPISCPLGHFKENQTGWALFGSYVHGLINPALKGQNRDVDMYMTSEFLFKYANSYTRNQKFYTIGEDHKDKVVGQGTVVINDVQLENFVSYQVDAMIFDMKELDLEHMKKVLLDHLDIRANAIIYYKGEVHELIPGAFDDIRNKYLYRLPTIQPRHRERIERKLRNGWTYHPEQKAAMMANIQLFPAPGEIPNPSGYQIQQLEAAMQNFPSFGAVQGPAGLGPQYHTNWQPQDFDDHFKRCPSCQHQIVKDYNTAGLPVPEPFKSFLGL